MIIKPGMRGSNAAVFGLILVAVLAFALIASSRNASTAGSNTAGSSATVSSAAITQTIAVPIAGPTGTQQLQVTVVCADAVRNGGFEASSARPWTGVANSTGVIYNDPLISSARARTGGRSGRAGSPAVNSYWNELLQTAQLPAGVTSVIFNYWRYLDTTETSRTRAYDIFSVGLETEQGIQIMTPQRIDNTSSGRGVWVQSSLVLPNASAYAGRRVWVSIKGATDSNLPSSLYVDDAQLIVCAAQ